MEPTAYFIAAICSLATAIVFLYAQALKNHAECILREKDCDDKREKLLERVIAIETERRIYTNLDKRIYDLIPKDERK